MAKNKNTLQQDFADLARIALTGRPQDVHLLLQRAAKTHRDECPDLAARITELLRESPTRSSPLRKQASNSLPVDADSRLHLIRIEEEPIVDHEPVYSASVKVKLDRIIEERNNVEVLLDAGVDPTRTVIFTGPPGVGKTMTARWLAKTLGKPLIILDLAAVMSSYLGRTGGNLRQVLDFAKSVDCVLLLDELDAIAKRRDDGSEIGELKRLVTVLIQQIDDWPATGLLIAATNHAELLDPAIWRRFEEQIEFPLPERDAAARFISAQLRNYPLDAHAWGAIMSYALKEKSFSDLDRSLKNARRAAALNGGDLGKQLLASINAETLSKSDRITLAAELVVSGVTSQRAAHELTGVARETIRSRVKGLEAERGAT